MLASLVTAGGIVANRGVTVCNVANVTMLWHLVALRNSHAITGVISRSANLNMWPWRSAISSSSRGVSVWQAGVAQYGVISYANILTTPIRWRNVVWQCSAGNNA